MERKNISPGSPMEEPVGFSRGVRIGNILAISGTAPISNDGTTTGAGDLYEQARCCLEIIQRAIIQVEGSLEDVIRTRVYLTDISQWEKAAKAHREFFGYIKPASTFLEVSAFINKEWLIEIEADCVIASRQIHTFKLPKGDLQ